jgi:hypothetical protein
VYWSSPSRSELAGKQRNLDSEFFVFNVLRRKIGCQWDRKVRVEKWDKSVVD